ncbi:MAG: PEP-CTERM sorting domain-containing protein [Gammaproteobacteria bacterium]|nr:PEP-CTERM sorting domain-containing protein [Gammaproteobacteria bacterium]
MKDFRLVLLGMLLNAVPVHADSLVGVFDVINGVSGGTVGGQVSFALNGDGTIAASLSSNFGEIVGFGYNSPSYRYTGSQFSQEGEGYITTAWATGYGNFGSGIYWTNQNRLPPTAVNWIIGNPGEFTSVWQAFGGSAPYDFYLLPKTSNVPQEWAANAVASVPEADTFGLMLFGLVMVGVAARRRAA